ncbi:MADS-box protein AGL42 isoform B, partial [Glycine soja]
EMVRGKVQLKKIEDTTSRQVTFSKRRSGLLKKAYELSVLCDAEVAVIVFSQNGRLYEFSSSDMTKILERYREHTKDVPASKFGDDYIQLFGRSDKSDSHKLILDTLIFVIFYMQQLKLDSASLAKKIELLEHSKRELLGQSVSSCSYDELKGIEEQLQISLQRVRQRKTQLYTEQIDQLRSQESNLLKENAKLSAMWQRAEKSSQQQWPRHTQAEAEPHCSSSQSLDVDTELFIGLPKQQC